MTPTLLDNHQLRLGESPAEVTNPDASAKLFYYGLQDTLSVSSNIPYEYTGVMDEEGGYLYTHQSAAGDTIAVWQRGPTAADGTYASRYLYGATFDGARRMIGARDAAGSVWTYNYDLLGNRLIADDPDLGRWLYVYDDANRLIRQTDARGKVTTITYDRLGRPVTTRAFDDLANATAGTNSTLVAQNTYDQVRSGYYTRVS